MIYRVYDDKRHEVVRDGDLPIEEPGLRYVHANENGWIPWDGGECPLPECVGVRCEVFKKDGTKDSAFCEAYRWCHVNRASDIAAYRPILDAEPDAPEWDGEGLPPVGADCQCTFAAEGHAGWHRGTVVLRGIAPEGHEWFVVDTGRIQAAYRSLAHVRPIRTPAHRAKDAAVAKLMEDAQLMRAQAERVVDAGYRKK